MPRVIFGFDDAARALLRRVASKGVSAREALELLRGAAPEVYTAGLLGWSRQNAPNVVSAFESYLRGNADAAAVLRELSGALGVSVDDLRAQDVIPVLTAARQWVTRGAQGASRAAAAAQAVGPRALPPPGGASGYARGRARAQAGGAEYIGDSVQGRSARGPYSNRQRLRSNHSVLNIWDSLLSPDTFMPGPLSTARWRRMAGLWSEGNYVGAALNTPGLILDWVREGGNFRTQAIRGTAALFGVGSAWRMLTGGTPFTDSRGRFNIAGIPFI